MNRKSLKPKTKSDEDETSKIKDKNRITCPGCGTEFSTVVRSKTTCPNCGHEIQP